MRWKPNLNRKRNRSERLTIPKCTESKREQKRPNSDRRNEIENGIENKRINQVIQSVKMMTVTMIATKFILLLLKKRSFENVKCILMPMMRQKPNRRRISARSMHISHNHLIHIFEMFWARTSGFELSFTFDSCCSCCGTASPILGLTTCLN